MYVDWTNVVLLNRFRPLDIGNFDWSVENPVPDRTWYRHRYDAILVVIAYCCPIGYAISMRGYPVFFEYNCREEG